MFKAYDIRGIYPSEITPEIAEKIGYAYGCFIEDNGYPKKIIIGRDIRNGSDILMDAFSKGALQKVEVDVLGMCTTPSLALLTAKKNYGGGVMVTASHNPKIYNGFKLLGKNAKPIGESSGLLEIKKIYENIVAIPKKEHVLKPMPILSDYTNTLYRLLRSEPLKKYSVVLDPGNSVSSITATPLFKKLNISYTLINIPLDGNFPDRSPNPLDGVSKLQQTVLRQKAAIGFAFDGDGDRLIVVDDTGRVINSSIIAQVLALHYLDIKRYAKIALDVRMSKAATEFIYEQHGDVVLSKTGHVNMKRTMIQNNAIFGAESSGHYYHRQIHYIDDAVYTALLILLVMNRENKKLSELVKMCKSYEMIYADLNVKDKDAALIKIRTIYTNGRMDFLDGIRIDYPDWRAVIRPSNTEDLLRCMIESSDKKIVTQVFEDLKRILL